MSGLSGRAWVRTVPFMIAAYARVAGAAPSNRELLAALRDGDALVAHRLLKSGASAFGYVHGKSGDRPNALNLLAEIQRSSQVDPMLIMVVHMGMGNTEEAIDWLEKAYRDHSGTLLDTLKVDPIFDSLRSHPRFQEVLKKMRWPD